MTKAEKRKLAELSLIYGVPIVTQARENSRLAGLQRKLQKLIMPDLMTLPNMGVLLSQILGKKFMLNN